MSTPSPSSAASVSASSSSSTVAPPPKIATGADKSYSLAGLFAAPKGQLEYDPRESFLLHVFWETPSSDAAHKLLAALGRCAAATMHNTPAVPTYFFRVSTIDSQLCDPPARLCGQHPQLQAAHKKLAVGIPRPAVIADLKKRGFDPSLLDHPPESELPAALQSEKAVRVELTEIYLDERAMMVHVGSRTYMDAYGDVMNPALVRSTPVTIRLGTPTEHLREKMLEPILKERVMPLTQGCSVWKQPHSTEAQSAASASAADVPLFVSWDVDLAASASSFSSDRAAFADSAAVSAIIPASFRALCTTLVAFPHPLREGCVRLMCVLPSIPSAALWTELAAAIGPVRGEVHIGGATERDGAASEPAAPLAAATVRAALDAAGLSHILLHVSACVGYALHPQATQLIAQQPVA